METYVPASISLTVAANGESKSSGHFAGDLHLLPCEIDLDGPASVSRLFFPTIKPLKKDGNVDLAVLDGSVTNEQVCETQVQNRSRADGGAKGKSLVVVGNDKLDDIAKDELEDGEGISMDTEVRQSEQRERTHDMEASFRGRLLLGRSRPLPRGVAAMEFREVAGPEAERVMRTMRAGPASMFAPRPSLSPSPSPSSSSSFTSPPPSTSSSSRVWVAERVFDRVAHWKHCTAPEETDHLPALLGYFDLAAAMAEPVLFS